MTNWGGMYIKSSVRKAMDISTLGARCDLPAECGRDRSCGKHCLGRRRSDAAALPGRGSVPGRQGPHRSNDGRGCGPRPAGDESSYVLACFQGIPYWLDPCSVHAGLYGRICSSERRSKMIQISCTINHKPVQVEVEEGETLMAMLRDRLGLTGTKRRLRGRRMRRLHRPGGRRADGYLLVPGGLGRWEGYPDH